MRFGKSFEISGEKEQLSGAMLKLSWASVPRLAKRCSYIIVTILLCLMVFSCNFTPVATGEVEERRDLWESCDVENYNYTLQVMCFYCSAYGEAEVQVRNNVTVSIVDRTTSPTMGSLIGQNERFSDMDTIDELFDIVDSALSEDADWDIVEVEYDEEYGYPLDIFLNVEDVHDLDFRVTITDFEVVE